MTSERLSDLEKARQARRLQKGWATEELKKLAEKELKEFRKISKDEPSDLVSGDMDRIIEGDSDEKE